MSDPTPPLELKDPILQPWFFTGELRWLRARHPGQHQIYRVLQQRFARNWYSSEAPYVTGKVDFEEWRDVPMVDLVP